MPEFFNTFFSLPSWSTWTIRSLLGFILGMIIYFGRNYFVESKKFRAIVCAEFEGLYPTPTKWPKNALDIVRILEEKYPRLEIAVHQFKGHLPTCFAKGFNKAWIAYYNEQKQDNWQSYFHYVPIKGTSCEGKGETIYTYDNTVTYKDNFKKNVDRLLNYAKHI